MFVLTHFAIIAAISLVVGKSITMVTDTGIVELLFDYPMNISILDMPFVGPYESLGSDKYGPTWAWLTNSAANMTSPFNETFSGTFVIQDSRAEYGVYAQPSGQRISGSVSCIDPSANISVNMDGYDHTGLINITYLGIFGALNKNVTLELEPSNLAIGKLIGQYLPRVITPTDQNATFIWLTNTPGIIPNATEVPYSSGMVQQSFQSTTNTTFWGPTPADASPDSASTFSLLFIGLCEHTVTFPNLPQNDASGNRMQYIKPSKPTLYLPPGDSEDPYQFDPLSNTTGVTLTQENPVAICDDGCMWSAVWSILLTWWGLQDNLPQTAFGMDIYCYGGVLSPVGGDKNQTCPSLDSEIWNRTLALVLDAMIQTYPKVGNASQTLFVQAESIGTWQWWLQGIIPLLAFILYVACLAYTATVYWVGENVKELNLLEVVNATRAEEEILTKSVMIGGDLKEVGRRLSE